MRPFGHLLPQFSVCSLAALGSNRITLKGVNSANIFQEVDIHTDLNFPRFSMK
jgi:hypothetical protein